HLRFANCEPILAAPWHSIAADLIEHLPGLGYMAASGVSAHASAFRARGLAYLPVHIDLCDWSRHGAFRGSEAALSEIVRLLAGARTNRQRSVEIGLLLHHRNADENTWQFLRDLAHVITNARAARWVCATELLKSQRVALKLSA